MKKRSIAAVVILTIITCGIYGVYWTYVVCDELQKKTGVSKIPPVLTTLLMLFVGSAGGALLGYDCNETVNAYKASRGAPTNDNSVLWIVVGVLLPVVTMALIQAEINNLPEDDPFTPNVGEDGGDSSDQGPTVTL